MMTKVGSTKIVNFMTTGAGVLVQGRGYVSLIVKCIFFLKFSSLLPGIDQTNQVCSNYDKGRVYQNLKLHDPQCRVLVLGRGHISHLVKMHYFF